jgi:putative Ca2+/H+ antiporter (TMEM165/GDT1 family)
MSTFFSQKRVSPELWEAVSIKFISEFGDGTFIAAGLKVADGQQAAHVFAGTLLGMMGVFMTSMGVMGLASASVSAAALSVFGIAFTVYMGGKCVWTAFDEEKDDKQESEGSALYRSATAGISYITAGSGALSGLVAHPITQSFGTTFAAEIGDRSTAVNVGTLGHAENYATQFVGALIAYSATTALAVALGKAAESYLSPYQRGALKCMQGALLMWSISELPEHLPALQDAPRAWDAAVSLGLSVFVAMLFIRRKAVQGGGHQHAE